MATTLKLFSLRYAAAKSPSAAIGIFDFQYYFSGRNIFYIFAYNRAGSTFIENIRDEIMPVEILPGNGEKTFTGFDVPRIRAYSRKMSLLYFCQAPPL